IYIFFICNEIKNFISSFFFTLQLEPPIFCQKCWNFQQDPQKCFQMETLLIHLFFCLGKNALFFQK
ncbi:MAG: hypothetical protein D6785_03380, partial [Planctomycetota bacterium]